ncbi:hypothetical protein GGX14DRAFT_651030 [Mycena pura]|uniref:Uncharacterized protein n=1 Tax=Mycena pura TaxID=153505 RepID=A0AAD7E2G0_9AGAR|nr:hypothetical protein GGX14DRAFT_651030 [Mycena pura]
MKAVKRDANLMATCTPHALGGCLELRTKDPGLFDDVLKLAKGNSLGAQLKLDAKAMEEIRKMAEKLAPLRPGRPSKKHKVDATQAQLPVVAIRAAGAQKRSENIAKLQAQADHLIMQLICVCGMSPNILRAPQWAQLMNTLNPNYQVTSETTFVDKYIPQEAAFVRDEQIKLLREEWYLTLTFDGGT